MARGHARHRGGNKWQLEVDVGKKVFGQKRNKRYKTVTARNEDEAKAKLAVFVNELKKEGHFEITDIGFVDFVNDRWVKHAKKELADTTFQGYVDCLENRILPAFQHFKLHEIKQKHILDFIENISEDGMRLDGKKGKLSSSQIVYHYRALKHVINYALTIKFIRHDPFEGVKKPREDHEEVEPYTVDETIELFNALEKEKEENLHWYIAVKLAVFAGLRRSEIYGMDLLKHVRFHDNVLLVRQALTHTTRNGYSITQIKKGSRRAKKRDIALPESLIEPLHKIIVMKKEQRLAFKKEELWREGEHLLLLSHPNGKPFFPDSMRNWWKRFLKRHKLRYVRIHGLRHTMVNLLIELDTPLPAISKRAGHSSVMVTSDIYGHRIKSVDEMATKKLEETIYKKSL